MKISIVAPNLNEARFLPVFLNSLNRQTFRNFEVIIVDGGSTDGSLKIIRRYASRMRIKIIIDHTRNIGYIRNQGARYARGHILFHTSTDTLLPPRLLADIARFYHANPDVISLAGRTFPLGTSVISHLGYQAFDLMRFLFTISPFPLHKYRPSGNFTTIKRDVFGTIGGFPNVKINEDGYLGQRLDDFIKRRKGMRVVFHLKLFVGHHAKRFEARGGVQTILFYVYVLGNMFPILKPLFKHIERRSAEAFASRSDLKAAA